MSRAEALSQGIGKNAETLSRKGISPDTSKLDELCKALAEAATRQEEAEKVLDEARSKAHKLLDDLKAVYSETKAPIKVKFAPEDWAAFGLPDKR